MDGWLRPMDVIQLYRLEMATRTVFTEDICKARRLDYWKPAIEEAFLFGTD
jgi:cytoplasmic iron level regulating protein YaaA (DUF328/UPF0246 family)